MSRIVWMVPSIFTVFPSILSAVTAARSTVSFSLIPVINSICFRSFPFFFRAAGMYILLLSFPAAGRAIPGGALFVESKTKTPSRNISIPGRGSYITFIKIPRYHPHWKASAFILSSVLRHTPGNTSIRISAHSPTLARNGGCRTALLSAYRSCFCRFRRSAPKCSQNFLFPRTLSVGDVLFLSASENPSLVLCIYL